MDTRIYLDHQATTPLDPRVAKAMAPWLGGGNFGHPASPHHAYGWAAERALETARAQVADLLAGAESREILFTSGGAEADSLALRGAAEALETKGRHVVLSAVERAVVRETAAALVRRGWAVDVVPVDDRGHLAPEALREAIRDDTVLVSVQVANRETGTVQDTAALGQICEERGVLLHADATAAVGWVPIDVQAMGVHLLSLTGHLFHGPMGIGALYVRRRHPRVRLLPLIAGGGTEGVMRGGTPNLPGAVGLGVAAEICRTEGAEAWERVRTLRNLLEEGLDTRVGGVRRLAPPEAQLPHASALALDGVEGEALLLGVPSVAFATGSACSGGGLGPSHVLAAMGLDKRVVDTNVRFGLGRFTTEAEIAAALERITEAIERLRAMG